MVDVMRDADEVSEVMWLIEQSNIDVGVLFGHLRSLLASGCEGSALLVLCATARNEDRERYAAEWLPYLAQNIDKIPEIEVDEHELSRSTWAGVFPTGVRLVWRPDRDNGPDLPHVVEVSTVT